MFDVLIATVGIDVSTDAYIRFSVDPPIFCVYLDRYSLLIFRLQSGGPATIYFFFIPLWYVHMIWLCFNSSAALKRRRFPTRSAHSFRRGIYANERVRKLFIEIRGTLMAFSNKVVRCVVTRLVCVRSMGKHLSAVDDFFFIHIFSDLFACDANRIQRQILFLG